MKSVALLTCLFFLYCPAASAQTADSTIKKLSDAPDMPVNLTANKSLKSFLPYDESIHQWKSMTDINNWIKDNFQYDLERAKQLAGNSPSRNSTAIYTPAELFNKGKGVCIDLARFAVETLHKIDTTKQVNYLLIEFEPLTISGRIITKHWLAVYKDTSGYYIFADSKRPGHAEGPVALMEDFISNYQAFRNRKIISWNIIPTYQKRKQLSSRSQKLPLQ